MTQVSYTFGMILLTNFYGFCLCEQVRNVDHALNIINDKPKPLEVYVFSNNKDLFNRFRDETSSGGIVMNDCVLQVSGFYSHQRSLPLFLLSNSRDVINHPCAVHHSRAALWWSGGEWHRRLPWKSHFRRIQPPQGSPSEEHGG